MLKIIKNNDDFNDLHIGQPKDNDDPFLKYIYYIYCNDVLFKVLVICIYHNTLKFFNQAKLLIMIY